MENVLEDDTIFLLKSWPDKLLYNKVQQGIFFFFFGVLIMEFIVCFIALINTPDRGEFFTLYSFMAGASAIAFFSYVTSFTKRSEFVEIHREIFPDLWPLKSQGIEHFENFKNVGQLTKYFVILITIGSLMASIISMPWFGDEYYTFMPVRVYTDYLGKWGTPFSVIFYISLFHCGVTIISNVFHILYLVLHLYNQCFLLNRKLEKLNDHVTDLDPTEAMHNEPYQNQVTKELVTCIQQHQKLEDFYNRLNNMIYYPIFFYTLSGVIVVISLVLFPKTNSQNLIRGAFVMIISVIVTLALCYAGQLLENESEEIFYSVSNLPWYLWNCKNRKIVQLVLLKTQQSMSLSSSGIVTINHQLLIQLYRCIYSLITFVINLSGLNIN